MLFQLNVGRKDASYYCKLVKVVVNDNLRTPKIQMFSEHKIPSIWINRYTGPGELYIQCSS